MPDHFHGHVTGHGVWITLYDVCQDMGAFFQRYQSYDVRKVFLKGGIVSHVIDNI
jgi:hypothetical protein